MVDLSLRPMTDEEGDAVDGWRYDTALFPVGRAGLTTRFGDLNLSAIDESGELVGYCSVSHRPVVPNGDDVVGLVWGLMPDRIGQGLGTLLGLKAVEAVRAAYPGQPIYAVIDACNDPSRAVAERAGFKEVEVLRGGSKLLVRLDPPRKGTS